MMLLPTVDRGRVRREPLLESWPKTCELIGGDYDKVRRRDSGVAQRPARSPAPARPARRRGRLYRFVRDQIETGRYIGVRGRRGRRARQAPLRAQGGPRREGAPAAGDARGGEDRLPPGLGRGPRPRQRSTSPSPTRTGSTPCWCSVELDGQRVFLDPTDRALGFGRLRAGHEGTPALLYDPKKPEGIVLPATPYDQNLQRAELDLALDARGGSPAPAPCG